MRFIYFLAIFCLINSIGYSQSSDYLKEINDWHKQREENLKKENGWLNLAGLFWLNDGKNTIGSNTQNDHLFPSDKCPDFLGEILLQNGEVEFKVLNGHEVLHEGVKIEKIKLFPADKPVLLQYGSLKWFIIKRGEKYAIRLRDLKSPFLEEFSHIEHFKIDPNWNIKSKFVKTENRKMAILDITGQNSQQDSPGKLVFKIGKNEHSLDVLAEGDQFFVIFGDKTNKITTYGGGRYIYTNLPDKDGNVWLDFNKAYNPPCAFTPYATCPLPPKQNLLSVKIEAGEKNYGFH
ncbi:DUF1684 domain-containing protein [Lacihabitans soyangensis]|uniref:DUF1684 domain-containing protein n=1 Tax=Lacihabitans soyangensis TaxID=869394 RepID=A0AAE3H5U9_9BACT|nr:DUF1684 domain-containing protein [Lacihabitans soyangensis]MCP9765448.1 DUF1684 domain-containing protein [Lacihabitans soyangensis]